MQTRFPGVYAGLNYFSKNRAKVIYLTYDRKRTGAKEILFTRFTENDIMDKSYKFDIKIVSKA